MMKRLTTYLFFLAILAISISCSDDDFDTLSPKQQTLLGTAVNFDASIVEPFATRATYDKTGGFNEEDLMVISRQYSNDGGQTFDTNNEDYRVYSYKAKALSGVTLNRSWKVKVGKQGYNSPGGSPEGLFTQQEKDTLTWDNGETVRFRAWTLSNMSWCLEDGRWSLFYPDFSMSSWVTASGPTQDIPMELRHLCCRLSVVPTSGNELVNVEITTDPADYKRDDNADTPEDDEADKLADPEKAAAEVEAVYNKMCMPGGVDYNTGLKAMSVAYRDSHANVKTIEAKADQDQMIAFNTLNSEEIKTKVVRPVFNNNDGNRYLVAIPHDMSTDNAGKAIVLPKHTRFRVYLRDVNNGDDKNTSGYEGTYHILSLSDIKKCDSEGNPLTDANGNYIPMFPNGLTLIAGHSYQFHVGYKYNSLRVWVDNNFSWKEQDLASIDLIDRIESRPLDATPYKWWSDAIDKAITKVATSSSYSYNPEFHITNEVEFLEFLTIINGTAAAWGKANAANKGYELVRDSAYFDNMGGMLVQRFKWFKQLADGTRVPTTKDEVAKDGFIFYYSYHPADGDNSAYSEEELLDDAYSFYSTLVNRKFKVVIDNDLDLQDWLLPTIGTASTPFLGVLDGQFHSIKNIYMEKGYIFDHAGVASAQMASEGKGAVISNIEVVSEHPLCVVNEGQDLKLIGIRMLAPSNDAALAEKLTGTNYIVGCTNEGVAKSGLVGEASGNMFMYGCMQTAAGITGGALLGKYTNGSKPFLAPQTGKVEWGNFMCNYYDMDKSPNASVVGNVKASQYQRQQYIRAVSSCVMAAWNDLLITDKEALEIVKQDAVKFNGFYGLAPYKALNYGIYRYNLSDMGKNYPCEAHYITNYHHRYPILTSGKLTTVSEDWNVLEKLN